MAAKVSLLANAQWRIQATVTLMQAAVTKMGNKIQDEDLQMLMAAADVDSSGSIDYEEFVAATVNLSKLEKEENFLQASLAALHICVHTLLRQRHQQTRAGLCFSQARPTRVCTLQS